MTKEQELMIALCGYLPYGICAKTSSNTDIEIEYIRNFNIYYTVKRTSPSPTFDTDISHIKPYLRPMSSMTEEEKKEWIHLREMVNKYIDGYHVVVDFYNKHHFDYRCLIEDELALEAPEGMYNN